MTLRNIALNLVAIASFAACGDYSAQVPWEVRGSPDGATATTSTDTSVSDVPVVTGPCAIADQVFTPYCVSCHDGSQRPPDLRAGALGRLTGAASLAYPGETVVVAGDSAASLLFQKLHPASGVGALMPPDGALDATLVDLVAAWIDSGAPACDAVVDPGPVEPEPLVPGGTITFSSPPSGFAGTQPGWAEDGTCTAQQWWQYAGDTEASTMHPGRACIACHSNSGGEEEGPRFSYAGTVYAAADDTDDCRGVKGVRVEILDDAGNVRGASTTNSAGNFYWSPGTLPFAANYRARLTYDGRTREMTLPQSKSGDCNTCHGSQGSDGALGRVVVP